MSHEVNDFELCSIMVRFLETVDVCVYVMFGSVCFAVQSSVKSYGEKLVIVVKV